MTIANVTSANKPIARAARVCIIPNSMARIVGLLLLLLQLAPGAMAAELRWGGDAEGGAPFCEADPNDPSKLRGLDLEVAAEIASGMGRTPLFVQVPQSSIHQSAARRDFD